jgi:hypothetical protein
MPTYAHRGRCVIFYLICPLVVTAFLQPVNRTFGIISSSDVGAWPSSNLFGTPCAPYFFILVFIPPPHRPQRLTWLPVFWVQHIATCASDPESISHALERGQIEQLTKEVQQVSLMQPSCGVRCGEAR